MQYNFIEKKIVMPKLINNYVQSKPYDSVQANQPKLTHSSTVEYNIIIK
jgi:hypothetical protein